MDFAHAILSLTSGGLVGFTLGLVGGGGSVLAVPLIIYVVGVRSPHVAIGTSAVGVALNALISLLIHARKGQVKWRCAAIFALPGMMGAFLGAHLGRAVDGQRLLLLFAILMIVVGIVMIRGRNACGEDGAACHRGNASKVAVYGVATGILSGFFGIGGGFLIVPALVASTSMPMLYAVGTSLVAVTLFGLSAALSYAAAGLVDWPLALWFVSGGVVGSFAGCAMAKRLGAGTGATLKLFFAMMIIFTAIYVIVRTA